MSGTFDAAPTARCEREAARKLMREVSGEKPKITLLADLVGEFVRDTEEAQHALETGRPRGPVTGLHSVDQLLGTYLAPGLHVLQGAPGCGKTAFALQIASDCFYPCLYVSAEMPLLELFRRLVARQTKTFLAKLKTGEIGAREAQRLALAAIENLPNLALMDCTRAYADVETICTAAEALQTATDQKHVLVVIDSLTVWAKSAVKNSPDAAGIGEYEIINQGVLGCTNIAGFLRAPVLALSHRNRAANNGNGGLHAAKGSGSIEYEAETVLDLEHSDKTERAPNSSGDTKIKMTAFKNRNGIPNVSVSLLFNGRTQSFVEAE